MGTNSGGNDLGLAICDALGIDPRRVFGITIRIGPGSKVEALVDVAPEFLVEPIVETLEQYELKPKT